MSLLSKSFIPLALIAGSLGATAFAEESKGFYFTAGGGGISVDDVDASVSSTSVVVEIESGPSYEVGFGYDFGNDIRTEITFGQTAGDFEKVAGVAVTTGDYVASTITANIYGDFSNSSKFTPYVGAGLGTTNIDTGNITISGTTYTGSSESAPSYVLKLGSKYEMSDQVDVFLEGKYTSIDDICINTVTYSNIATLGVHGGLNFKF